MFENGITKNLLTVCLVVGMISFVATGYADYTLWQQYSPYLENPQMVSVDTNLPEFTEYKPVVKNSNTKTYYYTAPVYYDSCYSNCGNCYSNNNCYSNCYSSCYDGGFYESYGYNYWQPRWGQPIRNTIRFFHNQRPIRRWVGGFFSGWR